MMSFCTCEEVICSKGSLEIFFTGTFERFCRNILEHLLREVHLSVAPA